jgi:hypothetical protein
MVPARDDTRNACVTVPAASIDVIRIGIDIFENAPCWKRDVLVVPDA